MTFKFTQLGARFDVPKNSGTKTRLDAEFSEKSAHFIICRSSDYLAVVDESATRKKAVEARQFFNQSTSVIVRISFVQVIDRTHIIHPPTRYQIRRRRKGTGHCPA